MVVYCIWLGSSKFSSYKLWCCCLSDLGQLNTNVFILLSSTDKAWKPSPLLSQPLLHSSQSAWVGKKLGGDTTQRADLTQKVIYSMEHLTQWQNWLHFSRAVTFSVPLRLPLFWTTWFPNLPLFALRIFCHVALWGSKQVYTKCKYFCIKQYNQDPLYHFSEINIEQERKAISLYLLLSRSYSRLVTL